MTLSHFFPCLVVQVCEMVKSHQLFLQAHKQGGSRSTPRACLMAWASASSAVAQPGQERCSGSASLMAVCVTLGQHS